MRIMHQDIDIELKGKLSDDMTDKEFFNFCTQNDNQRIERDENGQIFIMAPVNASGSIQNFKIAGELYNWSSKKKTGVCFDSSAGFTLNDKSVKSPDASWIKMTNGAGYLKTKKNNSPVYVLILSLI